jgi:hypothetical protein
VTNPALSINPQQADVRHDQIKEAARIGPEYPLEIAFASRNYTSEFVMTAKIHEKNRVPREDRL